ncbi:helix-turn-helix domain-containing protein [Cryobacterium tagatosivorans]|uniref:DNA-binding protein n=1 Tax=Cryobacterium tagatosivorans TaxID=1259199 RepID=A0A4R8UIY9_9MICO|nr:helix-turn-helix domain-containing protein [Cryobacterium tagatosivorans]TFB53644.1 DNA-binding protein [Cryobacterium tagatosivorans]
MIPSDASTPTYDDLRCALTVPQAEDTSGRSSFVLRDDIRTGRLPAYKVGGRWRILPTDLDAYLEALVAPSRGTR